MMRCAMGTKAPRALRDAPSAKPQDAPFLPLFPPQRIAHRARRTAAVKGIFRAIARSTSTGRWTGFGARSRRAIIIYVEETMKQQIARALIVAISLVAACSDYSKSPTYPNPSTSTGRDTTSTTGPQYDRDGTPRRVGFGFNGVAKGFPTGEVFLTGGGSYDPSTASNVANDATTDGHGNGGFRCTDGVAQGPLTGCATGEGVRWDTAQLLASAPFKCTPTDAVQTAVTGRDRVVLQSDFYRAGDGNEESFHAQIIVSATDLAPNIPGNQTLWIQGVGCAEATVNFGGHVGIVG
jgi:hypothetical protein